MVPYSLDDEDADRVSYSDALGLVELPEQVKTICDEMERQGWTCTNVIQGRGMRFICPLRDDCKHAGLWISTTFVPPEFLQRAFHQTCLEPF
jgi:hypothetical protein